MAEATPSWMLLGVASQVNRLRCPFSSNLYAKFSACFREPINCTMAKNCWWPSYFSCFSKTSMKLCPKHDCIITQSTAPGKLMSVARKTMSSPCKVVIDLWQCIKCGITCSKDPCHLQAAPGHGQQYGLYSQASSCSDFSVWRRVEVQPEEEYLQGNITVEATFSIAKLRILPNGPLQVGQHVNFGRQLEHTRCPLWHCRMGGRTKSKHTGHSKRLAKSALLAVVLTKPVGWFRALVPPARLGRLIVCPNSGDDVSSSETFSFKPWGRWVILKYETPQYLLISNNTPKRLKGPLTTTPATSVSFNSHIKQIKRIIKLITLLNIN